MAGERVQSKLESWLKKQKLIGNNIEAEVDESGTLTWLSAGWIKELVLPEFISGIGAKSIYIHDNIEALVINKECTSIDIEAVSKRCSRFKVHSIKVCAQLFKAFSKSDMHQLGLVIEVDGMPENECSLRRHIYSGTVRVHGMSKEYARQLCDYYYNESACHKLKSCTGVFGKDIAMLARNVSTGNGTAYDFRNPEEDECYAGMRKAFFEVHVRKSELNGLSNMNSIMDGVIDEKMAQAENEMLAWNSLPLNKKLKRKLDTITCTFNDSYVRLARFTYEKWEIEPVTGLSEIWILVKTEVDGFCHYAKNLEKGHIFSRTGMNERTEAGYTFMEHIDGFTFASFTDYSRYRTNFIVLEECSIEEILKSV